MARSAKIYDFTIPANGSFTLLVEGSYYRILSSSGALEVKRDGGSGVGPIYAGQGERDQEFKRITLVDKTGAINSGYIIISDGTFVDDRITGEVSVVDGNKARTLSDSVFMGRVAAAGVAAQTTHCQLWNPAGSGKNIVVQQFSGSTGALDSILFCFTTTQLLNTYGTGKSKKNGVTASTGILKYENLAAPLPTDFLQLSTAANVTTQPYKFTEPLIITPGNGVVAKNGSVNVSLSLSIEWSEDVIL